MDHPFDLHALLNFGPVLLFQELCLKGFELALGRAHDIARLALAQEVDVVLVAERMQLLTKDPRFLYPNTDEGRKQALARYQQILDEVNARMPAYFRTVPTGKLTVERVPLAAEKGSAGAYYEPAAMDGSRPGKFFANLRDTAEIPMWGMKTLAYHEGIPGHHFQISAAQNLNEGGITPTTVWERPSSMTWRSRICGSPPNRPCHAA